LLYIKMTGINGSGKKRNPTAIGKESLLEVF
jgi:hypothetical protein